MTWLADLVETSLLSPWVYLAVFVFTALDSVLPLLPSETLVIGATVYAVTTGTPLLWLVTVAAALGAVVGDHLGYGLGRLVLRRRMAADPDRLPRVRRALDERGGQLIVTARFVPGGRTAVTTGCGALGFPLSRFTPATVLAAVLWTAQGVLIGLLGAATFAHDPLMGVLVGVGVALLITAVGELVRLVRRRRRAAPAGAPAPHEPHPAPSM
ncbi:DedA family protein [Modestobacter roseus]|uniref:Membrane protein DedA with SNARE-associated domain n=1 Tax=Modestobacter roseus TaxID=1181884 RepID=A0A562IQS9_9ACTN|nr:DedA family protein [Modestobacter roseus]MQA34339.1 DedA family protein [Modestobacter roseus]TWH72944.1 membrane protein DedA with SNARE-associated domain [Modestobacter roseus]